MKNLCKSSSHGKPSWIVHFSENGRRFKRYFKSEIQAKTFLKQYKDLKAKSISDLANLPPQKINDIKNALQLLPDNASLTECVNLFLESSRKKFADPLSIASDWLNLKKENVSAHYFQTLKRDINSYLSSIPDLNSASPDNILSFVKSVSPNPKTQREYFNVIKEFFDYASKKNFCQNPFLLIHSSEIPKFKRTAKKIPTPVEFKSLFQTIEQAAPEIAGLYALVAFGGIRLAEAQRLNPENIDFDKKEILLAFDKSKTGDSWLQSQMPDNLWTWLKTYPPNKNWRKAHPDLSIKNLKPQNFPRNAFRHAFACYHLSLFRDAPKTSLLLRHRNPNTLWQNYLDTLVSKETAQPYFNILPLASL